DVGLLGGERGLQVRLGLALLRARLELDEVGNRDGREDADDRNHDHQLDEGKALGKLLHGFVSPEGSINATMCRKSQAKKRISGRDRLHPHRRLAWTETVLRLTKIGCACGWSGEGRWRQIPPASRRAPTARWRGRQARSAAGPNAVPAAAGRPSPPGRPRRWGRPC